MAKNKEMKKKKVKEVPVPVQGKTNDSKITQKKKK